MRGNRSPSIDTARRVRSIPACAGEPRARLATGGNSVVYPRVCGGTHQYTAVCFLLLGLSPRVRGNHWRTQHLVLDVGSIPACAGEPLWPLRVCPGCSVYPRVCGGTPTSAASPARGAGLSPRVRGNLEPTSVLQLPRGSIPACAGEPPRAGRWRRTSAVYPRVCGGTFFRSS